jgi:hypothetical protein
MSQTAAASKPNFRIAQSQQVCEFRFDRLLCLGFTRDKANCQAGEPRESRDSEHEPTIFSECGMIGGRFREIRRGNALRHDVTRRLGSF